MSTLRFTLDIASRELRNGMQVLAVHNPGSATFSAHLDLRCGRLDERDGEHGLAYLTGSCLEESTRQRSSVELAEAIENLGGGIETSAGGGSVQCPAAEAGKALRLLREALFEPAFAVRDVRRVQQEILAEIEDDDSDPRALARRRFYAEVYGKHPYGRPSYADAATIAAYKPAELRRFHKRQFAPDAAVLSVAGPLPTEQGLELGARVFRSLRGTAAERTPPAAPSSRQEAKDVHLPLDREQVHVFAGHPGIRRSEPDFIPLLVMDHVLGSGPGFTCRIAKRLRDELGLCYSVYASITSHAGHEPGLFTSYIGTSEEHRDAAVEGFRTEMKRLQQEPPGDAELRDVKDYLTGSYVFGLERNSNLSQYAVHALRHELGFDYLQRYPDLIEAVTADEVQRVAQTWLDPDGMAVVSAGAGGSGSGKRRRKG